MAIKMGLQPLNSTKCMHVVVESDSAEAVRLINGFLEETNPFLQLVLKCKQLHRTIRSSSVNYVPRNYNSSADCISKLGHSVCNNVITSVPLESINTPNFFSTLYLR